MSRFNRLARLPVTARLHEIWKLPLASEWRSYGALWGVVPFQSAVRIVWATVCFIYRAEQDFQIQFSCVYLVFERCRFHTTSLPSPHYLEILAPRFSPGPPPST